MATIHLKRYYRHLAEDITLEVPDEIAVTLSIGGRLGDSFQRRKRDRGECSLDTTPGFEADVTPPPQNPAAYKEQRVGGAALSPAHHQLPPRHSPPATPHYILGISKADLARNEGVDERNIRSSIQKGLRNLEKSLKNLR